MAPPRFAASSDIADVMVTFGLRLNECLDRIGFPHLHAGRYSTLAAKYGVSRQQGFRWCNGQGIPNPAVLIQLAADLGTTIDHLLGAAAGPDVGGMTLLPLYRIGNPEIEAVSGNFMLCGHLGVPLAPALAGKAYAVVRAWSDSIEPPFLAGDDLLVDMGTAHVNDGDYYLIRTATNTSIRIANMDEEAGLVRFHRNTPRNATTLSYPLAEVHFHNGPPHPNAEWRKPGTLILGRIDGFLRNLLAGHAALLA